MGELVPVPVRPRTLTEIEESIENARQRACESFYTIGADLREIQGRRLYAEAGDRDLVGYARRRWGYERSHAYRLIAAAEVVDNLSPTGETPATERQARELAELPPELQRVVWLQLLGETNDGKQPTADQIGDAARALLNALPADRLAALLRRLEGGPGPRAPRQVGGEDWAARQKAILRACKRLRRLIDGRGDEAGPVIELIEAVEAAVVAMP